MGAAVGGAFGGVAVILALVGLVYLLHLQKRCKPAPTTVTVQTNHDVEMRSTSTSGTDAVGTEAAVTPGSAVQVADAAQVADTHAVPVVGQLMSVPVEPPVVGMAMPVDPPIEGVAVGHNGAPLFPMHTWEVASSELDWTNSQELGRGAFGVVRDVLCATVRIAAKRMDVTVGRQRADIERLLRREFRALQSAVHDNVVQVLGVVVDNPNFVCLLIELANSGSLRMVLDFTPERVVGQPSMQINISHDISSGMAYLHCSVPPIIHHNIKPENVRPRDRTPCLRKPARLSADCFA